MRVRLKTADELTLRMVMEWFNHTDSLQEFFEMAGCVCDVVKVYPKTVDITRPGYPTYHIPRTWIAEEIEEDDNEFDLIGERIMNVKHIILEWLIEHEYDGLYTKDCGCALNDLIPCEESCINCKAGYKRKPTPEELAGWWPEVEYMIGPLHREAADEEDEVQEEDVAKTVASSEISKDIDDTTTQCRDKCREEDEVQKAGIWYCGECGEEYPTHLADCKYAEEIEEDEHLPNAETLEAIREVESGDALTTSDAVTLIAKLNEEEDKDLHMHIDPEAGHIGQPAEDKETLTVEDNGSTRYATAECPKALLHVQSEGIELLRVDQDNVLHIDLDNISNACIDTKPEEEPTPEEVNRFLGFPPDYGEEDEVQEALQTDTKWACVTCTAHDECQYQKVESPPVCWVKKKAPPGPWPGRVKDGRKYRLYGLYLNAVDSKPFEESEIAQYDPDPHLLHFRGNSGMWYAHAEPTNTPARQPETLEEWGQVAKGSIVQHRNGHIGRVFKIDPPFIRVKEDNAGWSWDYCTLISLPPLEVDG